MATVTIHVGSDDKIEIATYGITEGKFYVIRFGYNTIHIPGVGEESDKVIDNLIEKLQKARAVIIEPKEVEG